MILVGSLKRMKGSMFFMSLLVCFIGILVVMKFWAGTSGQKATGHGEEGIGRIRPLQKSDQLDYGIDTRQPRRNVAVYYKKYNKPSPSRVRPQLEVVEDVPDDVAGNRDVPTIFEQKHKRTDVSHAGTVCFSENGVERARRAFKL